MITIDPAVYGYIGPRYTRLPSIGYRKDKLLVIGYAPRTSGKLAQIHCRCDCGNEVTVRLNNFQKPWDTASCGCNKRVYPEGFREKYSSEYGIWNGIKNRCYNSNLKDYKNYGARGITVCDEWLHDFKAFLEHVGPRPSPKHTLDRMRNAGNYEPGNVRWATNQEQLSNTRVNRNYEFEGQTLCLAEIARRVGLTRSTLRGRLHRGQTLLQAIRRHP